MSHSSSRGGHDNAKEHTRVVVRYAKNAAEKRRAKGCGLSMEEDVAHHLEMNE